MKTCEEMFSSMDKKMLSRKEQDFQMHSKYIEDMISEIESKLDKANLPCQIIHKDFNRSNFLFRRNKSPVVIDFEMARLDWKIIDIINGWEGFCFNRNEMDIKKVKLFIKAYGEKIKLSSQEIFYIPTVWCYLNLRRCILFWYKYRQLERNCLWTKLIFILTRLLREKTLKIKL